MSRLLSPSGWEDLAFPSGMSPDLDIPLMFAIVWGEHVRGQQEVFLCLSWQGVLKWSENQLSALTPLASVGNAKQPMASLGILGICLPGPVILREFFLLRF